MRSDKPDFSEFFLIVDLRYQTISIVYDLKPRPVIFNHLRSRKISKDVLPAIPLSLLHNIFPRGQAFPRISMLFSKLIQPVQINDNHRLRFWYRKLPKIERRRGQMYKEVGNLPSSLFDTLHSRKQLDPM